MEENHPKDQTPGTAIDNSLSYGMTSTALLIAIASLGLFHHNAEQKTKYFMEIPAFLLVSIISLFTVVSLIWFSIVLIYQHVQKIPEIPIKEADLPPCLNTSLFMSSLITGAVAALYLLYQTYHSLLDGKPEFMEDIT